TAADPMNGRSPDASRAPDQLHFDGEFHLVPVDRRPVIGDLGLSDNPAATLTRRPFPAVAGRLRVGGRDLLGPAEVNGVVHVSPAVEFVTADRPAQAELERVRAIEAHG